MKEFGKGLLGGFCILWLIEIYKYVVKERINEYFDFFVFVLIEIFKGDEELCEFFYNKNCYNFFLIEVLKVWIVLVVELIFLDLFKEDIEL